MAVVKAVSSRASISQAIDYVTKREKTDERLLTGQGCEPDTAREEMQSTKELWGKTGGRTYKHFVQSFAPGERITTEQAHTLACEFARNIPEWKGFEVLIATHKDKKNIHTHFIVNSVSYEDGHKLQQSKNQLQEMKEISDRLCLERGLHITEKGKTFDGRDREETSAYRKETYQLLKKAEHGEVQSYVQDIALAILGSREQATSREDFIRLMNLRGFGVDWQDSHKYITFTDLAREQAGEKRCKVRHNKLEKYYNMDFGKEGMEHEFERNARAAARPNRAATRTEQTEPRGDGKQLAEGSVGAVERAMREIAEGVRQLTTEGREELAERAAAEQRETREGTGRSARAGREAPEQQRGPTEREFWPDWGLDR